MTRRTFVYDKAVKKFVEKGTIKREPKVEIIKSFEPFLSPVDGSIISDRSSRREHNARNGVEDVGNDPAFKSPKLRKLESMGTPDDIRKSMQQLGMW